MNKMFEYHLCSINNSKSIMLITHARFTKSVLFSFTRDNCNHLIIVKRCLLFEQYIVHSKYRTASPARNRLHICNVRLIKTQININVQIKYIKYFSAANVFRK